MNAVHAIHGGNEGLWESRKTLMREAQLRSALGA